MVEFDSCLREFVGFDSWVFNKSHRYRTASAFSHSSTRGHIARPCASSHSISTPRCMRVTRNQFVGVGHLIVSALQRIIHRRWLRAFRCRPSDNPRTHDRTESIYQTTQSINWPKQISKSINVFLNPPWTLPHTEDTITNPCGWCMGVYVCGCMWVYCVKYGCGIFIFNVRASVSSDHGTNSVIRGRDAVCCRISLSWHEFRSAPLTPLTPRHT